MRTKPAKKWLAVLLCLCIAAVLLTPAVMETVYAGHHCHDEDCGVCAYLHNVQSLFSHLRLILLPAAAQLPGMLGLCLGMLLWACFGSVIVSLVQLRVRLNR